MNVIEYLEDERERPFVWGETDCAKTADRWVQEACGFSPMKRFGRVHTDEAEAAEWLSGSLNILWQVYRVMRASGFKTTKQPKMGDVGVILVSNRLCVALFDGCVWHSRDEGGFIGATEFRRAWSI